MFYHAPILFLMLILLIFDSHQDESI